MRGAAADGLALGAPVTAAGAVAAEVAVAAGSPWFTGHFPGHPILPAVAQLLLADRLHRAAGGVGRLARVEVLRLSEPVRPGDLLVARLGAPDVEGRRPFHLARQGAATPLAAGRLAWSAAAEADEGAGAPARVGGGEATAVHRPAAPLLPHRDAALLLATVAAPRPGLAVGRGAVPVDHPAVRAGRAPAFLAVELAAQVAAAAEPELPTGPAAAAPGVLVRLRDIVLARPDLPADTLLVAGVERLGAAGALATFRFTVALAEGEPVARGELATYRA